MTGMDNAIEKAARAMWRCDNPDLHPAWVERSWGDAGESGERAEYELRARALAEAGLLAPAPLTEMQDWAWLEGWSACWDWTRGGMTGPEPTSPYSAEGDGRAEQ